VKRTDTTSIVPPPALAPLSPASQAIHPGYGFLSENADLSEACAENGIIFVGPPAETLRVFGDKTKARKLAERVGVPVVPGA